MNDLNLPDLEDVQKFLNHRVPSGHTDGDTIKRMATQSDVHLAYVAEAKRDISVLLSQVKAAELTNLKKNEDYQKMNADEKKTLLEFQTCEYKAAMEYVEDLQRSLKGRVTLCQALLKSIALEMS